MPCESVWNAIDKLSIISKSDPFGKIKQDFFKIVAVSILLYRYTMRTLIKLIEKKLVNYTIMSCVVLNKSRKKHPSKKVAVQPTVSYRTSHESMMHKTWGTTGKARMNWLATFSYRFLHMDMPMSTNQQRLTSTLYRFKMQLRKSTRSKW